MLIAIEEHWMPAELDAALAGLVGEQRDESVALNHRDDAPERLADLGAGRLAAMDAQGIDLAVLAVTPPGTQALEPADAVRLSRVANDAAAAAVARHPDRLRAMSTLPLGSPADAVAELERAAGLGHVGTVVHPHAGGMRLDDPALDEVWAAAARLGQPVFLHPQIPDNATRDASYRGFSDDLDLALATFGWGWHVEAGLAALRLVLRGTFDRHPSLQLVLGHWGELLVLWLDRAASLARIAGLERSLPDYVRSNVFITCSGMLSPALRDLVLTVTTPDRLAFSTDYPFQLPTREDIDTFLASFDSAADREAFASVNATTLFGLDR